MSIMMYMLRRMEQSPYSPLNLGWKETVIRLSSTADTFDKVTPRMAEFKKKLREKTPIGKLEEQVGKHPYEEEEPLSPWPNGTNPHTGEIGGPKGPEPTRYGDWERKGRVSDF